MQRWRLFRTLLPQLMSIPDEQGCSPNLDRYPARVIPFSQLRDCPSALSTALAEKHHRKQYLSFSEGHAALEFDVF